MRSCTSWPVSREPVRASSAATAFGFPDDLPPWLVGPVLLRHERPDVGMVYVRIKPSRSSDADGGKPLALAAGQPEDVPRLHMAADGGDDHVRRGFRRPRSAGLVLRQSLAGLRAPGACHTLWNIYLLFARQSFPPRPRLPTDESLHGPVSSESWKKVRMGGGTSPGRPRRNGKAIRRVPGEATIAAIWRWSASLAKAVLDAEAILGITSP